MSSLFQPISTTQSALDTTEVANGKAYFVQDSERLFFDYKNVRTEIRDIIILNSELDRDLLIAPKNKFYFVVETSTFWLYRLGEWIRVGMNSSDLSITTQSFNAGSGIVSVQLDNAIPDVASIISINVDGKVLLKSAYMLNADKKTIEFNSPVNSESGIDVIYTISDSELSSVEFVISDPVALKANSVNSIKLTANKTLAFSGLISGKECLITVYLEVASESVLTIDYPNKVIWKDGKEPNLEVGKFYVLQFRTIDAGNIIFASIDTYVEEGAVNEEY